jgi:hypothetical protein
LTEPGGAGPIPRRRQPLQRQVGRQHMALGQFDGRAGLGQPPPQETGPIPKASARRRAARGIPEAARDMMVGSPGAGHGLGMRAGGGQERCSAGAAQQAASAQPSHAAEPGRGLASPGAAGMPQGGRPELGSTGSIGSPGLIFADAGPLGDPGRDMVRPLVARCNLAHKAYVKRRDGGAGAAPGFSPSGPQQR